MIVKAYDLEDSLYSIYTPDNLNCYNNNSVNRSAISETEYCSNNKPEIE